MKPNNKKTEGKSSIYGFISHVHRFKQGKWAEEDENCPVYSPPQKCAKSACIWYNLNDHECWVLHPKPMKDKSHKG